DGVWAYIVVAGWTSTDAPANPVVTLGTDTADGLDVSQPFTLSAGATSIDVDWDVGSSVDSITTTPANHTDPSDGTHTSTHTPTNGTVDGTAVQRTYVVSSNLAPSMTLGAETIDYLDVSQPFTTSDPESDTVTVTADWDDGTTPAVVTSPATHSYA